MVRICKGCSLEIVSNKIMLTQATELRKKATINPIAIASALRSELLLL